MGHMVKGVEEVENMNFVLEYQPKQQTQNNPSFSKVCLHQIFKTFPPSLQLTNPGIDIAIIYNSDWL